VELLKRGFAIDHDDLTAYKWCMTLATLAFLLAFVVLGLVGLRLVFFGTTGQPVRANHTRGYMRCCCQSVSTWGEGGATGEIEREMHVEREGDRISAYVSLSLSLYIYIYIYIYIYTERERERERESWKVSISLM
jgi:hypothetical protein